MSWQRERSISFRPIVFELRIDDVRLGGEEVERIVEVRLGKLEDALPVGLDRDWIIPAKDNGIALDRFQFRVAQDTDQRVVLPEGLEA